MNKKQLVCMWCGIVLIAIPLMWSSFFAYIYDHIWDTILRLLFWSIAILLITGGFIYTFRDRPKDKEKEGVE